MTHTTDFFDRAVRQAKALAVTQNPLLPCSLVFVGKTTHQFNYAFLQPSEGESAALLMKAVCQRLSPEAVVSIATVRVALGEDGEGIARRLERSEEALLVVLARPAAETQIYLALIERGADREIRGFREIKGLEVQALTARIANPFRLPKEGLPDWLLHYADEVLQSAVPDDRRSSTIH